MNDVNIDLKELKDIVENLEQYTLTLKAKGAGIPMVEKNVRIILSAVHNLHFGIVDPAIVLDE